MTVSKPTPASSKIARLWLVLLAVSGTFALIMGDNFKDVWHIVKE